MSEIQTEQTRQTRNLLRDLFSVTYYYDNVIERQRASATVQIGFIVTILLVWGLVAALFVLPDPQRLILNLLVSAGLIGLVLLVRWRINQGELVFGAALLVFAIQVALAGQFYQFGFQPEIALVLALPIAFAAQVLPPRFIPIVTIISLASVVAVTMRGFPDAIITMGQRTIPADGAVLSSLLAAAVAIITLGIVSYTLADRLEKVAQQGDRSLRQIDAAAVVAEVATSAVTLNELLETVVERIRDAYEFYHAQVFLVDDGGRMARLRARTGRAGEALLARSHALPVGSQSVVGRATASAEPVVVNDVTRSATHRPNPLLPRTRAELALPLIAEGEVIGVIDVQSIEPDVFQPEDIRTLQLMASQLAASIQQARLVDALQVAADENRALLAEAQRNLRQIEDLNRRLTREGWSDYMRARRMQSGVGYTATEEGQLVADTRWSAPMRQAYNGEQSVIIRQDRHAHVAAIPLRVRGEVIGVMELERGGDNPWTDDDLQMAETLVDRMALALENARLYEQSTLAVEREQFVNTLSQQVQGAESIDDVLRTALVELGDLLGAARGVVQISPRDEGM
ncbi:MAG: GAF domain-containing protein [Anaerolineae bacterium]